MQIPSVAKEFLMMHLSADINHNIDYQTLEILPETFIDENLRRSQVDALFKVKCGTEDLLVYVLIEHQSKPDYTMPTRRLSYKSDIWSAYLETHNKDLKTKLPPIIDLHFYTGPKPYDGPLSLADLAGENTALVHQSLIQPMINVWAGDISEEQLKTHPWAATIEYIMNNRKNQNLRHILRTVAPNIRMFYVEGETQFVLSLYTYIENVYTYDAPIEELARIAGEEISTKAEEDIMTIAERLRKESKLEGEIEIIKKMLANGVEPAFIAKNTGFPVHKIKELQKK